jgi:hypothetical protein
MLQSLANASALGREALAVILSGHAPAAGWLNAQAARLDAIAQPHAATELPVIIPLKLLVTVAAEQDKRAKLTPEAWKQHLLDLMFPATKTEKSP